MRGVAFIMTIGICALNSAAWCSGLPEVHEVTIATPDTIAIEIREQPFERGGIVPLSVPAATHGAWIKQADTWGLVVGRSRGHIRRQDGPPVAYLNRGEIDRASDYGQIGGRNVIDVYRKSVPYDSGFWREASGNTAVGASFKHYVYLKLDGALRPGDHSIRWPGRQLPDTSFSYDERKTRALAIRVNQNGYAPDDEGKIAYLALWLPRGANDGAVDFHAFGIRTFQIIDADNRVAFSGNVTLSHAPGDPEEGTGLPGRLVEYRSLSHPSVLPLGFASGNPIVFKAPRHRLKDNQPVLLNGFAGALASLNGTAIVSHATSDQFSLLNVDGRALAGSSEQMGAVAPLRHSNRAGTFVFRIDFSLWQPVNPGEFRVFIPGLGVSDKFRVAADVWLRAARTAVAGLYHHRSGIEIDGRFGYKRPVAFKPNRDFVIYQSKLPLAFSSESSTGFVPFVAGAASPWIEGPAEASGLWGGYMDAGDWDRRINHVEISYAFMDLYEHAGARAKSIALNIPKSREVLDSSIYADSDDLPDLLHEAIWNMDFFRRLQLPDGKVRGGIESSGHPILGEPSYLESQSVFVYAPDHVSGYRYAGAAAKLAQILTTLGKADLAKLYAESAISAWRAAEIGYNSPEVFYREALDTLKKSQAADAIGWDAKRTALQAAAASYRIGAAAALYRLTEQAGYRQIFEKAWADGVNVAAEGGDGAWEYLQLPAGKADSTLQQAIRQAFAGSVEYIVRPQASATYMNLKNAFAPAGWGQGLVPDYNALQLLLRSHVVSGDKRILAAMQFGSAHILGANQVGLSFTTGLGVRNVKHPLHEDHRAMGVETPAGITIYGWAPQAQTSYNWIFGADWAPLSETALRRGVPYKRVEPDRLALPFYEHLIEYPGVIIQQEYTVQQTIGPTAALWIYLYAAAR